MTGKTKIFVAVTTVGLTLPQLCVAQTATFTPLEDGHVYTVDGVAAATAIVLSEGGAAFADATARQVTVGNSVIENNVSRHTVFAESGNNNTGIVQFNQDAGNMNNQANAIVIALGQDTPVQFADIVGSQTLAGNTVVSSGPRQTRIEGAFDETRGIIGINQSAGNLNQQLNVVAIAMGQSLGPDVVALADSTLDNMSAGANELVQDEDNPRHTYLVDSFTGFDGIAQVSQSSGDLNRIANTVAISVEVMTVR